MENGVVIGVGVTVERLWIVGIRYDAIGRYKSTENRIVITGFVELKAGSVDQLLLIGLEIAG